MKRLLLPLLAALALPTAVNAFWKNDLSVDFNGENYSLNKKPTKEIVNKAYQKIQKKIHPDISPETSRLSAIVNEAKEIVLKDIS